MYHPSDKYESTFAYLDALRKRRPSLSLASPLDMPSIVARNHLMKEYYALRLSKTCFIVNAVARVSSSPPPMSTIYLFGPDLVGEKEAVEKSGFFMCFPRYWDQTNGHSWSRERLGLNMARTSELLRSYESFSWLQEAARRIDQLATEEVIHLAYDFAFERPKPDGSRRVIGMEAFCKTAVNTISRNFMRAGANRLLRDGLRCTPDNTVIIQEVDNDLNYEGYSNEDCLKIGPSNLLLTYQGIYLLAMYGWKANVRSLSYLLACKYLRSMTRLKEGRRILKESSSYNQRWAIKSRIESELAENEKLEKSALKFVRQSVDSLINQDAVADIGNAYLPLGNRIRTPYGDVDLDPYQYNTLYSLTLQNIRDIDRLTKKPYASIQPPKSDERERPLYSRPKIYIASTCHDFRDLRQEVARSLREWGYQPMLNEDSDFPVKVGVNSYQACVEAVKQADCLVLIVGTRHGGEVEGEGISVTELEYKTACSNGIPRINFCLNSLWDLIPVRRKNPNMDYPDYFHENKEKVDKIFEFLDRVRTYEQEKTDNWVHPFRNSVELKEILRKRLINANVVKRQNPIGTVFECPA